MTVEDFPAKYPYFFDLDFVRRTVNNTQEISDEQLLATMLDPNNKSPHNPNCIFDSAFYRTTYLTKKKDKGHNPILHYLSHGVHERAAPNFLFDPVFFRKNAGTIADQFPTMVDYALSCSLDTLPPFHPFIDVPFLSKTSSVGDHENFLEAVFLGQLEHVNPHPLFDIAFINQNTDANISTIHEAIDFYWNSGLDIATHILFDVEFYKSHFGPETNTAHSVYHYLITEQPHSPQPLFDLEFYIERARLLLHRQPSRGLEDFIVQGQEQGIDPSPYFDLEYYRNQANCDVDALQHFVGEGYKHFSPHPMIKLEDPTLFNRAYEENGTAIGRAFLNDPRSIPLSATPDFAPHYFARKSNNQIRGDKDLREIYFRDHYLRDMPPNGLLSSRYIAQCGELTGQTCDAPFRYYFRERLHERQRVLIALENLEDTLRNRAWLALMESQHSNLKIEFIVVALKGGPLGTIFAENAHIWILGTEGKELPTFHKLLESGRFLSRNIQSNTPSVAFVETNYSALLLPALDAISTKKIVFGGSGIMDMQTQCLEYISSYADKVLCEQEREQAYLEEHIALPSNLIEAGFKPTFTSFNQSESDQENKCDVRASLGLPKEATIVLSSGQMTLENGIDIFGALAAKYCSHPNTSDNVHFIWHGTGPKHPNSPWFYAQYFVEMAAGKERIQNTQEFSLDEMLANANVYFHHPRDGSTGDGAERAKVAGIPVVLAEKRSAETSPITREGTACFEPFDLDAACNLLINFCSSANQREQLGLTAQHMAAADGNFDDFLKQIKRALVKIDVIDNFEAIAPSDLLLLVLDKGIAGPLLELDGVKSLIEGREIIRIETSSIPAKGIPIQLYESILNSGYAEIAIDQDMASMEADYISQFSNALCVSNGAPSQIEDLYRIGLGFEKIFVRETSAIRSMATINPLISALMFAYEEA